MGAYETSSRERIVSTSKSLVGSSIKSTLPPDLSSFASWTRLRSPPLRLLTLTAEQE